MSAPATPLALVRSHYDASARQDLPAMLAPLSPQVRWTEMAGFPCAGTWIGPQAVAANVFEVLGEAWDGDRFELERLNYGGEHVVGIGTYRGHFHATGQAMAARVTQVWAVQGGLAVAFEQFTDKLLVGRAMR